MRSSANPLETAEQLQAGIKKISEELATSLISKEQLKAIITYLYQQKEELLQKLNGGPHGIESLNLTQDLTNVLSKLKHFTLVLAGMERAAERDQNKLRSMQAELLSLNLNSQGEVSAQQPSQTDRLMEELKTSNQIEEQLRNSLNLLIKQVEREEQARSALPVVSEKAISEHSERIHLGRSAIKDIEKVLITVYKMIDKSRLKLPHKRMPESLVLPSPVTELAPESKAVMEVDNRPAPALTVVQPSSKKLPPSQLCIKAARIFYMGRKVPNTDASLFEEIKKHLASTRGEISKLRMDNVYRALSNSILATANLYRQGTIENRTEDSQQEYDAELLVIITEIKLLVSAAQQRFADSQTYNLHAKVAAYVEANIKGEHIDSSFQEIISAITINQFGYASNRKIMLMRGFMNGLDEYFQKSGSSNLAQAYRDKFLEYKNKMLPKIVAHLQQMPKHSARSLESMDLTADSDSQKSNQTIPDEDNSNSSSVNSYLNYTSNANSYSESRFMKRKQPPVVHKRDSAPNKLPGKGLSNARADAA